MSTFLSELTEVTGERWRKEMEIEVTDVTSAVSVVIVMVFYIISRDDCLFEIV